MTNTLYYGDNLDVLREMLQYRYEGFVDLVYLDPPFNSNRDYSVIFASKGGDKSNAQITAFEDSWHWGPQAEKEYHELLHQENTDVAEMIVALRSFLGENDMMAYLVIMANRLLLLHKILKTTGSLYLHCDPTASHYLKIILDGIFQAKNFRSEIVWKRQSAHSDAKHRFPAVTDSILFYSKSDNSKFYPVYAKHDPEYISKFYRYDDDDERGLYQLADMASPNPRPNMMYEWKGFPYPKKGWRFQKETMLQLDKEGRIYYPMLANGGYDFSKRPRLKRYLSEQEGSIVTNIWTDIHPVHAVNSEYLGYPTQKPLALLERIICASSKAEDVVLDPFCGCGTAVHAAQKLNRRWIGIDITHLAISLIEKRLRDAFPGIAFDVHGTPKDLDGARDLAKRDKFQFEWWACSLVNAQPYGGKKRGADSGIDGIIYFQDESDKVKKIIVSVKGGEHVSVSMIRDLKGVIEREKAAIGLFVTLNQPTRPMETEAVAAGYYESPHFAAVPKIQILTIEGLMDGTHPPQYPDMSRGGHTFKKAKREQFKGVQEGLEL